MSAPPFFPSDSEPASVELQSPAAAAMLRGRATTMQNLRKHLLSGQVIPAHPLALNAQRKLDERRQRALTRYYVAAGAGGIAAGVHTTQCEIRLSQYDLLRPVLELASHTADVALQRDPR